MEQQGERARASHDVAGRFAAGHRQTSTEWMRNRHWITKEGLRALAAAEAADRPRLRVVPSGGRS